MPRSQVGILPAGALTVPLQVANEIARIAFGLLAPHSLFVPLSRQSFPRRSARAAHLAAIKIPASETDSAPVSQTSDWPRVPVPGTFSPAAIFSAADEAMRPSISPGLKGHP